MKLYRSLNCGEQIYKMKLSSDSSLLATLSGRHTIILWTTKNFQEWSRFTFVEAVRDFAFAPDLTRIAVLTADDRLHESCAVTSTLQLFNMASQALQVKYSLLDVRSIVFLSSDTIAIGRLGRGGGDDHLSYIDIVDLSLSIVGEVIPLPLYEMPFELTTLPKLNLLVSLGIGLAVWDIETKALLQHIHCDNLQVSWDIWESTCCCVLEQHNQVAIGFISRSVITPGVKICLFDATTWSNPKWYMDAPLYPTSIALSPNGKYLAASLSDHQSARVWDTLDGSLVGECMANKMTSVVFSPDNQYLIIGAAAPNELCLWEL